MADFVVDSSVWVAAYVTADPNSGRTTQFFADFQGGTHTCHLPRLVLVEVSSAINRQTGRISVVSRVVRDFWGWEQQGRVRWYDLDRRRMELAIQASTTYRLKGADSTIAALGDELGFPVLTFDGVGGKQDSLLGRYPKARVP
ncbi:MAG: PIN domain-containing protein [Chloroflexi bacterium]|nr:PIN domain-containing protein [Chloroflexota bacterium]